MSKGRVISEFLLALARQIEHLTDEELNALLRDAGIDGILRNRSKSLRPKNFDRSVQRTEAEALMQELANQPSRESARELLIGLAPSRRVLVEAAKVREVHIAKEDTISTISEKLVENVVGSRLDSARIRGG
jgi:hypothetical protein